jgi:phospholipid/cholesterol/gamma-HCH transport system substrate-binding protein
VIRASGEIVDNALAISRDLRQAVAGYSDPKIRENLASFIASVAAIASEVRSGQGTLHALVYDPKTTQEFKTLMVRISNVASRLDGAVTEVETFLHEARESNGAIHALVYDKKGAQLVTELGAAAGELAGLIHDAKTSKNGAVHQLVYGDAQGLFANLGGAAADLKVVTSKIRSGEGTVGGLINDPTVYESLREILGNIKRNRILRALVRMSISNGENLEDVGKPEAKK